MLVPASNSQNIHRYITVECSGPQVNNRPTVLCWTQWCLGQSLKSCLCIKLHLSQPVWKASIWTSAQSHYLLDQKDPDWNWSIWDLTWKPLTGPVRNNHLQVSTDFPEVVNVLLVKHVTVYFYCFTNPIKTDWLIGSILLSVQFYYCSIIVLLCTDWLTGWWSGWCVCVCVHIHKHTPSTIVWMPSWCVTPSSQPSITINLATEASQLLLSKTWAVLFHPQYFIHLLLQGHGCSPPPHHHLFHT